MTTETDLQAERSVGEGFGGSAEQSSRTRQVETRPAEVLQLVRREEFRGGTSRVVNVIVLQQLRQTHWLLHRTTVSTYTTDCFWQN